MVIALVRCLCVVKPLSFKNLATPRRQVAVIVLLSGGALVIPVLMQSQFFSLNGYEKFVNRSALTFNKKHTAKIDIFINLFLYGFVSVITVSMCFLIFTVTKSSKFQSLATGKGGKSAKAANKEAQLIKTVIIILAIFLCCNIPVSGEAIMRQAIPGFSLYGPYKYEANVWRMVVDIGLNLNVSLNVVAYYTTNSAYRKLTEAPALRARSGRRGLQGRVSGMAEELKKGPVANHVL
ncbi:hypothetical protein ElyMa_000993800 [Elysia marginata]|uniref:G-protein coupled receptors family 1 profile domain-containing protein n=1 Tax=Elysia marginata TaxID=1093978 RepID=A0AAV4HJB2_9GAST|nr:hypothetical protein ElyMa_000993800 [Elysia marginata]